MTPPRILLPVAHRQQAEDADCLAACAAMVLDYMGIPVAYDRLLKLLRVQWFGAFASNIRALEQLGVIVIYKQGTLAELVEHLTNNRPPMVFVATSELPYWTRSTQHAVVVVGIDETYIYVNDPAISSAPVPVSHGDFGLAWLERDEFYAALMKRS